jgi:hypothetical protein
MIEVLKQMQEALREYHYYTIDAGLPNQSMLNKGYAAYQAGKQAIADLESQEPVGEVDAIGLNETDFHVSFKRSMPLGTKLYAHPPQRTWVGLTTNEIVEALNNQSPFVTGGLAVFARALEAKLKEKNT